MHPAWALAKEYKDEAKKEERLARIQDLEDRVCSRAAGVLEAALSFHEVTPTQQEPPEDWVEMYGEEGAHQRLAVAKAGWLPQSLAPNAVKLASQVYTGISRARHHRVALHTKTLNVKIALPAPTSAAHPVLTEVVPEKEIEG